MVSDQNEKKLKDGYVPEGFFRRICCGLFTLILFISMLAGSCLMVNLLSYEEAYIVKMTSQSENMAIKAWVLNTGNVFDVSQTEGCLTKYKSGFEGKGMECDFNKCVGK